MSKQKNGAESLEEVESKSDMVEDRIVVSANVAAGYKILDNLLEGCQVIGYDWRYLYVNDVVAKHGKKTKKELLGKTMMEAYPGIEKTTMFSQLQRCMNERVPISMESEFKYPSGEKGWFELSVQPVPEGILILSTDISERKEEKEIFGKKQRELDCILDSSPTIIFYKDKEGKFIQANRAFAEAVRIPKEELLGKTVFDLYSAEIAQAMTDDDAEVMGFKRPKLGIIEPYESPTGLRWIRTDKIPNFDENGVVIGLIGFSEDITERKEAEEALRKSEIKYRTLVENLSQKIFFKDRNLVYVSCNESYAQDLKISDSEIEGKTDYDFYPKELAEKYRADDKRVIESGKKEDLEEEYIQSKQKKFVHTVKTPVKDETGKVVGVLGIFWDVTERKKTEEALRDSTEKWASLTENTDDLILIVDGDGIIKFANKTMPPYNLEEAIGKTVYEYIPREQHEAMRTPLRKVFETREPTEYEISSIIPKIGAIWFRTKIVPIKHDGKVTGAILISTNITESKKIEETLRESEERYRVLVESAADAIFTLNEAGDFLSANQEAARRMGKAPEDIIGKNMHDLFPEGTTDLQMKRIKAVFQTGNPVFADEAPTQTKLGQRWYNTSLMPVRDSNGTIVYVIGIARDITERKWMEEQLRQHSEHLEELVRKRTEELSESEKKYSVVVEEASDGVVVLQNEKIVFTNQKVLEILGYLKDELIGLSIEKLVSEKYRRLAVERYQRRLQGEEVPASYEIETLTKTGESVPVELSATRIDYRGHPADLVIIRDIRERKRLEEQRLRLEKMAALGEAAAMVGHDLRNPLQAIKNAAYVLEHLMPQGSNVSRVPALDKVKKMIEVIDDSVSYADSIVLDLRDFSADKEPNCGQVDVNALVDEVLHNIRIPNGVTVDRQFSQVPLLSVDADQIKRVFQNLVQNAVQAMQKEGMLTVVSGEKDGFVEVAFNDTGAGISKEAMKKLFSPFFTTKAQGMGMGLAICKKFVEANDGTIAVKSQEGEGTTFTVRLPIGNGEVKT
jgi:PAS domain S-box-containing protein